MASRRISWSDLPEELLLPIADRLEQRPDILHFRTVCKAWRRSATLSLLTHKNVLCPFLPHKLKTTQPPLLKGGAALREELFYGEVCMSSLKLVASSIFLIKSTTLSDHVLAPWLVAVEELNPGKLRLLRTFSRFPVENVPQEFPKELNLSRFEVEEMGKVYSLRFDYKPYHLFEENHKVLLLNNHTDTVDDCTAAVLYDNGILAAIRLKDENVQEAVFKARKFDDIVIFKGRVYAIDRYGRAYWMDNSSSDRLKMWNVVENALHSASEFKCRLVESCGELYMVRKCMLLRPGSKRRSLGIRVFRLNKEQNGWDELDSIGDDRILFVTPDCGFFAQTSSFPGWKWKWKCNCILALIRKLLAQKEDEEADCDSFGVKCCSKSSSTGGFCTQLTLGQDCASQSHRESGSIEGIFSPLGSEPHTQVKTHSSALQILEDVSAKDAATDVQGKMSIAVDSTFQTDHTRANSLQN